MNKTTGSLILAAALASSGTLADTPTTWYVATNGNDSAAGTGWDTAFRTIAKGVSSATGVRDTVIVSNGTYLVTAPVSVDRAITLCGLSPNPRDTVIDGGGTTYCLSLSASNAVACGITVSNGYATTDGGGARVSNGAVLSNSVVTCCRLIAANWWYTGGGVYVENRGSVFADCEVSYNYVTNGYGGGVGMNNLATMTNCLVVGNQCVEGYNGGVYMTDGSTAVDCTIRDNTGKYGGGIGRGGTIRRCLIAGNRSLVSLWDGGGGGVYARSKTVIEDCVITNNTSAGMGGGIAVGEIGSFTWIRNCLIAGNAAPKGGGVSYPNNAPSSFFSLTDCVIRDNTATNTYGGGVWFGDNSTCPSNLIRNCLFAGNSSKSQGGGLYLKGSNLTLTACTVVGNTAGSGGGGGLVNGKVWPGNNSAIAVSNCLFFGNHATGSSYSNLSVEVKADTNLFFHSFEPGGMLPGAKGNVSGDPMFENYAAGDYRLAQGSPCCNAGATEPWMLKSDAVDLGTEPAVVPTATYGVHLDFGNKRRVCGPEVDIGAYERYYLSGTMIRLQ